MCEPALGFAAHADEISGHVGDGTAEPKPFLGWLRLLGALDRLLSVPRPSAAQPGTLDAGDDSRQEI